MMVSPVEKQKKLALNVSSNAATRPDLIRNKLKKKTMVNLQPSKCKSLK